MRIVIDATAANSGGQVYLTQLLPRLAALSEQHEYIVFHTGGLDELRLSAEAESRFRFHRISLLFERTFIGAGLMKMLWRSLVLPVHLYRLRPALFFSNAGLIPRFRRPELKTVLALHNSMPLREDLIREELSMPRRWRLQSLRRLMRKSLREADGSIVFSRDSKTRIVHQFDDLRSCPSVVHHGIEWGARERAGNRSCVLRFGIEHPYILFVSQIHRYKNVLRLLQAFSLFTRMHPEVRFVLVGEAADPAYWREIEAAIEKFQLRERVIHLPRCEREDLRCLYRNARAFIHPSLAETCSFPLLEAMAMGVPIAAAAASALPEIAGDAALYFDPEKSEEMATALDRLMRDEPLRDELSRRAIARAKLFSWENTARETLQVFERVTQSSD